MPKDALLGTSCLYPLHKTIFTQQLMVGCLFNLLCYQSGFVIFHGSCGRPRETVALINDKEMRSGRRLPWHQAVLACVKVICEIAISSATPTDSLSSSLDKRSAYGTKKNAAYAETTERPAITWPNYGEKPNAERNWTQYHWSPNYNRPDCVMACAHNSSTFSRQRGYGVTSDLGHGYTDLSTLFIMTARWLVG